MDGYIIEYSDYEEFYRKEPDFLNLTAEQYDIIIRFLKAIQLDNIISVKPFDTGFPKI